MIDRMESPLSREILKEYIRLKDLVSRLPSKTLKEIDGTGGKVSVADLIAYQIGWGKALIRWYEAGLKGEIPQMPGDGFTAWNYAAIARFFYETYAYDGAAAQDNHFKRVVEQILDIVEKENATGQLDRTGIWPWCTLPSGKQWPLSKWIKVNTASPYKRASVLIKKWSGKSVILRLKIEICN